MNNFVPVFAKRCLLHDLPFRYKQRVNHARWPNFSPVIPKTGFIFLLLYDAYLGLHFCHGLNAPLNTIFHFAGITGIFEPKFIMSPYDAICFLSSLCLHFTSTLYRTARNQH
jgi:hypothetical protein